MNEGLIGKKLVVVIIDRFLNFPTKHGDNEDREII